MSSVACAPAAPQAQPPARHGTCRLFLHINGYDYSVKPVPHADRPLGVSRAWRLRKLSGEREGTVYHVLRCAGLNSCTCPDFAKHAPRFACKHIRALVAAGLLSARRSRPSEEKGGRS